MQPSFIPRLMSKEVAAYYCSLPLTQFMAQCPVAPIKIGAKLRYDRVKLDEWIDGESLGGEWSPAAFGAQRAPRRRQG